MKIDKLTAQAELRYLELLSHEYKTIREASTEIINLESILNLPKGTEHFLSDIHGEDEAFLHILSNASGVVREKIDLVFSNTLSYSERDVLSTLIYYPERKLEEIKTAEVNIEDWYRVTLYRLVEICRTVSSKYTRAKVRAALSTDFGYIIDELLYTNQDVKNKEQYYQNIIATIIDIDQADAFILDISTLIKRLAVDRLHIVGDIFDRGPHPDVIMEKLIRHHSVDIEWGNHDIVWLGAAAGSKVCIAIVLAISLHYNNLDLLESGYGINLLPLALFADRTYGDSPLFRPINMQAAHVDQGDKQLVAKMTKAISVIQFKLEGQLLNRRPEFKMDDRAVLSKIDFSDMTYVCDGEKYPLLDSELPTVNPENPNALTPEEFELFEQLKYYFENNEKLQRHAKFLYSNGSVYRKFNDNLLFHGCVPVCDDGEMMNFCFGGADYAGKKLLDYCDSVARQGYYSKEGSDARSYGRDFFWFLWNGRHSPLFGRDKMTTFERFFVENPLTHIEQKNAYYSRYDSKEFCEKVLAEFDINSPYAHIINGHVPVRAKDGEGPVKAGGRLIVIDGGFCKAYQGKTGIAGYTMFYSSYGIKIVAHAPFTSAAENIAKNKDILFTDILQVDYPDRILVADTDEGKNIREKIADLKQLLHAFMVGLVNEK